MAFDEHFADRVRGFFKEKHVPFDEKRMMGGLCFMVNEKMCVGVDKDKSSEDRLMLRLDPEDYEWALEQPGATAMDFTGRPMKGFVFVSPEAVAEEDQLARWLQWALDYNPKAKSSKKRAKKSKK